MTSVETNVKNIVPETATVCDPNNDNVVNKQAEDDNERNDGEKVYYACEICQHKFSQNKNLKIHMRNHTGELLNCEMCDKKFNQSSHLRIHMRIHTGERPFACEICDKTFTENKNLKTHMRTHTGERPFTCKICHEGFARSDNLRNHMRNHTGERLPLACGICQQGFLSVAKLNIHMRIHTGEQPYSCEICDKKFNRHGNLKAHMKTHTGERPFTCQFCHKGFMRGKQLKVHMTTHPNWVGPEIMPVGSICLMTGESSSGNELNCSSSPIQSVPDDCKPCPNIFTEEMLVDSPVLNEDQTDQKTVVKHEPEDIEIKDCDRTIKSEPIAIMALSSFEETIEIEPEIIVPN